MNFARIINNVAIDVCPDPRTHFHSQIAGEFVPVPDDVRHGWVHDPEKDTWSEPAAIEPEPETLKPSPIPAAQFMDLFTPAEEMAIIGSTDPMVKVIYARLQRAALAGGMINPTSESIADALEYLSTTAQQPPVIPSEPYIRPTRVEEIKAGVLK